MQGLFGVTLFFLRGVFFLSFFSVESLIIFLWIATLDKYMGRSCVFKLISSSSASLTSSSSSSSPLIIPSSFVVAAVAVVLVRFHSFVVRISTE